MLLYGWMLGAITFGAGELVASNWYEYRVMVDEPMMVGYINRNGWERVPNQPDPLYVRRARIGFH